VESTQQPPNGQTTCDAAEQSTPLHSSSFLAGLKSNGEKPLRMKSCPPGAVTAEDEILSTRGGDRHTKFEGGFGFNSRGAHRLRRILDSILVGVGSSSHAGAWCYFLLYYY
jgi:hypothetical protein